MHFFQDTRAEKRNLLLAFCVYLGVTCVFFAQVGKGFFQSLIGFGQGGGDALVVLWDAWWINKSLFEGNNPYFCNMIFAPFGTPLVFHFLLPLPASVIATLNYWLAIELSYNLVLAAAFPLGGVGSYILCRYLTKDHAASLVGGFVFMLSPYLVSKINGHMNLLYGCLLPFFFLSVLKATLPQPSGSYRRETFLVAILSLLIVLVDPTIAVFAANLVACTLIWRVVTSDDLRKTLRQLTKAFLPTGLLLSPYIGMVIYYTKAFDLKPEIRQSLYHAPEPLSYVLPFTPTSVYNTFVAHLGFAGAERFDLACYLGILVFPLCIVGLFLWMTHPVGKFFIILLFFYLILSLGPKLQLDRQIVHFGKLEVYLPFILWRKVPVLGAIGQTGRYLVITYLMMSVGMACLVTVLRAKLRKVGGYVIAAVLALVVCADYAFRPTIIALPPAIKLSSYKGVVFDPRSYYSPTMYYQTIHNRPLIGGYISRAPHAVLQKYQKIPALGCLLKKDAPLPCDRETIIHGLKRLKVTDILSSPADWRENMLIAYGFRRHYQDSFTVVWSVPKLGV